MNVFLSLCQSTIIAHNMAFGLKETNNVKLGHTCTSFMALTPQGPLKIFFLTMKQECSIKDGVKRRLCVIFHFIRLWLLCCSKRPQHNCESFCDWHTGRDQPGRLQHTNSQCLPWHHHIFTNTRVVSAKTLTLSVGTGEITGMMCETKQNLL